MTKPTREQRIAYINQLGRKDLLFILRRLGFTCHGIKDIDELRKALIYAGDRAERDRLKQDATHG